MIPAASAALAADKLSVRLGGREVLKAITLAFLPGQVTAVVGPNGAGKSTLLTCLAGLRRPQSGRVQLDGEVLQALTDRARAKRIGYLPQTPEVAWRLNVDAFVSLGRTAHQGVFGQSADDAIAVETALSATRLTALAKRDVTSLSGGERARALIARVLAGTPQWLIADEPLSGLDPAHQLDVADLLKRFAASGGGVIVTVHDLAFAARAADRVIVVAQGEVLSDGTTSEALTEPILKRAYGLNGVWIKGKGGPLLDIVSRLD